MPSALIPIDRRIIDEAIPNKFIKENISITIAPAIYVLGILLNKMVVTINIAHKPPTHNDAIIIDNFSSKVFIILNVANF
jgi:hypothetical protein